MKNFKKKLLIIPCIVGMLGLGYVSSAKAFESKIPTDSPVVETITDTRIVIEPLRALVNIIIGPSEQLGYKGTVTLKTLENGVRIIEMYNDYDGKIGGLLIDQPGIKEPGKPTTGILEIDKGADGDIDYRITFNDDSSILYKKQLPDGSVRKELIK